ncbi:MAG: undecaprenyl/decaprenyl-phosphate alpha-N-acetylglucosaminyl 1-phosphate transferase [Bacteroidetes bacterium]|nr:undecaprenyl/decaprenyl-phosphate alpha-N-acetylglucosaminyl 1-phosphate transferase [Bacteroidota bacterium]
MPAIIRAGVRFELTDKPDQRKLHKNPIPTLGGIGIFLGFFLTSVTFMIFSGNTQFYYIIASLIILFVLGILDDLKDLSPSKKFLVQFITAFLIAFSGIRIEGFYGFLGIQEIPVWFQYMLTIVIIVGVTNAFNLIDGIDGLAGGVSFINTTLIGIIFLLAGESVFSILAFALAGSLLAFLYYNFHPAKIFMGDTGSLIIGFTLAVIGILIIQKATVITESLNLNGNIMIVMVGIFLIPVYDTLRVFIVRMKNKKSPFRPDKNHIHHLLIETGYNHTRSALVLYFSNLVIIGAGFMMKTLNPNFAIPVLFILAILMTEMLNIRRIILNQIRERFLHKKADEIFSENRFLSKNLDK